MIFLDTHTVLWLYLGDVEKFSTRALNLLKSEELLVSPMVRLELQYLYEIGRSTRPPTAILRHLRDDFGLQVDTVDFAHVVEAAEDEGWTRDPFDRIITAHAKKNNAALITSDQQIQKNYSRAFC